MTDHTSLYDQNDYYGGDAKGSRLSPILNPLLSILDRLRVLALLRKLQLPPGRALDVGAGDGKFLWFLSKKGWNVTGTTASRTSQAAAQNLFGVKLEFSLDLPLKLQRSDYQLITYWHVFEHLQKPEEHIELWPSLLAPQGWLVIEVPNIESLGAKMSYRAWLGSDPVHHLNHQPLKKIKTMLERVGLNVRRTETFSLKFSYVFLWSALLGFCFPKSYDFDFVLDLIKRPLAKIKKAPLRSLNALAGVLYFAPLILALILFERASGQGEVIRIYAQK